MTVIMTPELEDYCRFLRDIRRVSSPQIRTAVYFATKYIIGQISPDELTEENYQDVSVKIMDNHFGDTKCAYQTRRMYYRFTRLYCEYMDHLRAQDEDILTGLQRAMEKNGYTPGYIYETICRARNILSKVSATEIQENAQAAINSIIAPSENGYTRDNITRVVNILHRYLNDEQLSQRRGGIYRFPAGEVPATLQPYYRWCTETQRMPELQARRLTLFAGKHLLSISPETLRAHGYSTVSDHILERQYAGRAYSHTTRRNYARATRYFCEFLEYMKKQETQNEN